MALSSRFFGVVFLTILFFSIRYAAAQTPPPGISCPPGWLLMSAQFPNTLLCPPSTFVNLEVWFCIPDPNGSITPKEMIIIKAVRKLGGGALPCPLTGMTIRQLAESIMFDRNPGGWTVPVNCSQWCFEHPECPCPALYPQWVSSNGSCGKLVQEGDSVSIVMCGEVDEEGQNCYYSYQVCKNSSGGIWSRWVGKQIQLTCPGTSPNPACTIPLCDDVGKPQEPTGDTCKEDTTGTISLPKPDLTGVGMHSPERKETLKGNSGFIPDRAIRKENE